MSPANLALRFGLELCALAALAYWGARTGSSAAARVALALGAPIVAAFIWGAIVSPRARFRTSAAARLIVELALFAASTWALWVAGRSGWASTLGAAVVLHESWRAAEWAVRLRQRSAP